MSRYTIFVLLAILTLALLLRLVGLNWDDHSHLHPDERFLTGMASDIGEAESLTSSTRERCQGSGKYEYFNTACSVYNPSNVADGSYAYGTLPLFIVRIAAQGVAEISEDKAWLTYDYIHFVGRAVNAAADALTVFFVFLIGVRLFSVRHGLSAAFFYACAVLPIQLSHFWTVDILSNLFFVISLYALIAISQHGKFWWYPLFGVALGAAVASRLNLVPAALLLPAAIFLYLHQLHGKVTPRGWLIRGWAAVLLMTLAGGLAFVSFRTFQPYAFVGPTFSDWGDINAKWLEDVTYVSNLSSRADDGWPPSNQWFGRISYLYPWWNLAAWGLGTPLGLTATLAVGAAFYSQIKNKRLSFSVGLFTLWILIYFGWQGGLHQMTMR
ncbi:MAG: glycosyltransferase family 39 protein, partial [Anaerolineae bacterium]|nr:glycosyltransferase family 39 protein [Anaerolineae bacterium]